MPTPTQWQQDTVVEADERGASVSVEPARSPTSALSPTENRMEPSSSARQPS
jgi:hypothetical protein